MVKHQMHQLFEGGNVFKDKDGNPLTQRINQADVKPTLAWLEQMLPGLDLQNNTLGSTGIKDTSGDLDIAVDAKTLTKEQLIARLSQWCESHGMDPKEWVRKTGTAVHFKTPITGRPQNGFVQTDFMFLTNVPWSKFVLGAMPPSSQYKGVDRNVLMNSIAKSMGYKLNQIAGIADRATNTVITDDPNKVAKLLLSKRATKQDLSSVEAILSALQNDPQREAKLADFRAHMEREGRPFDDGTVKEETETSFMARLRDRIVNQGMSVIVEAKEDIRIPHVEDLVFDKGTRGIEEALAIIAHSAENTKETVTIKWDGKPAVIFGRKPNGEFVLTDKSGFTAVGYDGLATSPQQIADIMARRDASAIAKGKAAGRSETLVPLYQELWPYLAKAVPRDFKGFVKGDLLYTNQPQQQAGLFVFQPNAVEYRIPINSPLGKKIANSKIGIAIHTQIKSTDAREEPLSPGLRLNSVDGLLLTRATVEDLQSIKPDSGMIKKIRELERGSGEAINNLFKPELLRANKITDLPALCVRYINSRVGTNFNNLLPQFGTWLKANVTDTKLNNIINYINEPARGNKEAMVAAFSAFIMLHDLKMDLLRQLDLQQPGQEGWVMATPHGRAKLVNRLAGGFTAANRALNNPG